jgi:coproporphyrinogen III oxidase
MTLKPYFYGGVAMIDSANVKKFLKDVAVRFENFCSSYNPKGSVERKSWDVQLGHLDVTTFRGETFEKASSIYCDLTIDTPPVLAEKLGQKGTKAEAQVLEINFYPVNPYIPRGYMELRTNITDKLVLAGGTDLFPYFPNDSDTDHFATGIKEVCTLHSKSYEELRKIRMDFFKSKYRKGKVGIHAGIYSFHLEERDFPFFQDLAETFFKLYGQIVEKRKGEKFTDKETEEKLKIQGLWAEWVMVEDEGTKFGLEKGIPPEALLGAILPPKAAF